MSTSPQEQLWTLTERLEAALMQSDEVAEMRVTAANDALEAFLRDHPGQTLRAFNPESIARAFDNDLEGWNL